MIKNPTACGAWRGVELNGDRVRLPKGAALDVGGIAKGWTVDLAAARLPGVPWAIIDAGGDLRIVGTPPPPGLDVGADADPRTPRRPLSGTVPPRSATHVAAKCLTAFLGTEARATIEEPERGVGAQEIARANARRIAQVKTLLTASSGVGFDL